MSVAHSAPTVSDASLALGYDDNQSNASASADRESGFTATANASIRHRRILDNGVGLQFSGGLTFTGNERFGDLTNLDGGGEVSAHFKPVKGFYAPWYSVRAGASLRKFNGSRIRDSLFVNAGASVGMRLGASAAGNLGYSFDWRNAFNGSAFDTKAHRLFASVDYKLAKGWSLYGRYDLRIGDTVSTATPSNAIINAAEVIERDDAFGINSVPGALLGPGPGPGPGPGLGPLGNRQRFAYRLDSVSHSGRIGVNYQIRRNLSFDLSTRYRKTLGDGDNDYRSFAIDGAISYRF